MPSHSAHHAGSSDYAENPSKRMKLSTGESSSGPKLTCSQMIKRFTLDSDLESDQSLHDLFVNGTTMEPAAELSEKEGIAQCKGKEVKLPVPDSVDENRVPTDFTKVEELVKREKPSSSSEKTKYEYALVTYYNVVRSCVAASRYFSNSPDRGDELRISVLKRNLARRETEKYKRELTRKTPKRKAMSLPFFFRARELFPQTIEK